MKKIKTETENWAQAQPFSGWEEPLNPRNAFIYTPVTPCPWLNLLASTAPCNSCSPPGLPGLRTLPRCSVPSGHSCSARGSQQLGGSGGAVSGAMGKGSTSQGPEVLVTGSPSRCCQVGRGLLGGVGSLTEWRKAPGSPSSPPPPLSGGHWEAERRSRFWVKWEAVTCSPFCCFRSLRAPFHCFSHLLVLRLLHHLHGLQLCSAGRRQEGPITPFIQASTPGSISATSLEKCC